MKRKIIFLVLIISPGMTAFACDICGCGAGSSYIGILPDFRKRFIGWRYQQNGLQSHLGPGGLPTYLSTTETYRSMELWGAANIGDRFRVAAFIPFSYLHRANQANTFSQQGPGDITIIGYYELLNKKRTVDNSNLLVQSLWIGAGVKLPTGRYDPADKNIAQAAQNTFQLGTGSMDYSLHAMYDIRLQDAGINTNASYKINTANKYDYRYGNKFTLNMLAYYKWLLRKKITLAPNAGALFETATKDRQSNDISVFGTGGYTVMGTVGLELSIKQISAGANFQTPLSQKMGEGKIKAGDRGMVYISYSF